jgi:hypothetical protein
MSPVLLIEHLLAAVLAVAHDLEGADLPHAGIHLFGLRAVP